MNILDQLLKDHDEVENLFSQIEAEKNHNKKKELLKEIKKKLTAHNHAEESIFYTKLIDQDGETFLATKGQEEHDLAENYMEEIENESDEMRWEAKLEILRTMVGNHILEEEEEIFDVARESFSEDELTEMGNEFLKAKKENE